MKPRKEQIDQIEEAFRAVHGKEVAVAVSPSWETKVMWAVRSQAGPTAGRHSDTEMFGHLVWRFALATCLVALLLTAYTVAVEPWANTDVARLFFEEPFSVDLVRLLEAV